MYYHYCELQNCFRLSRHKCRMRFKFLRLEFKYCYYYLVSAEINAENDSKLIYPKTRTNQFHEYLPMFKI